MSDSVPSLEQVSRSFQGWEGGAGHATLHALVLAYSRHHDPAVRAAREAMESARARSDREMSLMPLGPDDAMVQRIINPILGDINSALRLLDGKAVGNE